ncbi:MAG: UPF0058 family protein [Euryarchaeota archaeon]|nr:UPF0058 family protein [Euryarchaeota archaeon]
MYKDEMIHLHQLLLCLCKFLEDSGAPKHHFNDYVSLGISPYHIHKRKVEHKYAIYVLSKCISSVLAEHGSIPKSTVEKFEEIARKCREDIY